MSNYNIWWSNLPNWIPSVHRIWGFSERKAQIFSCFFISFKERETLQHRASLSIIYLQIWNWIENHFFTLWRSHYCRTCQFSIKDWIKDMMARAILKELTTLTKIKMLNTAVYIYSKHVYLSTFTTKIKLYSLLLIYNVLISNIISQRKAGI